jgi:glycosyltransferase involved in cell wall biosynthesis
MSPAHDPPDILPDTPMPMARGLILMGLYNGAAHLAAQLQSFADQTHGNWQLVVGDDGSTDDGPAILRAFADETAPLGPHVQMVNGPCQGVAKNFLSLLAAVPDADWLAFSDQDDVWLPEHLETGLAALADVPAAVPALYGARSWICDADLSNRTMSPRFYRPPGFRNALVQSIAGGNTMLLNRAGVDLARAAAIEALAAGGPATHDWWLYQLIAGAGGHVIRDEVPTILYRQHGGNLFGTNRGFGAVLRRFAQILRGDLARWVDANIAALSASAHRLTPTNRAIMADFATLRGQRFVARLRGFARLGLYRQGRVGQAMLWLALTMKKL